MPLWVDKYRPLSLAKLDFHDELTERLQGLAKDGDLPHLMIYGPTGAGKKTRITALLREMFGPGVEKRRLGMNRIRVSLT
jgi:replication factor C subunit 3/5